MVRAPRPVGPDHKSWRGQKALSTVDLGGTSKTSSRERLASASICSRPAIKASAVSPSGNDSPQRKALG